MAPGLSSKIAATACEPPPHCELPRKTIRAPGIREIWRTTFWAKSWANPGPVLGHHPIVVAPGYAGRMYIRSVSKRLSHLWTCRERSAVMKACDCCVGVRPKGCREVVLASFVRTAWPEAMRCKAPTRGLSALPCVAGHVSHSREPARAFGSE